MNGWLWNIRGIIVTGESWNIRLETCPSATLPTTYCAWTVILRPVIYLAFLYTLFMYSTAYILPPGVQHVIVSIHSLFIYWTWSAILFRLLYYHVSRHGLKCASVLPFELCAFLWHYLPKSALLYRLGWSRVSASSFFFNICWIFMVQFSCTYENGIYMSLIIFCSEGVNSVNIWQWGK